MNRDWILRTARLDLVPVGGGDYSNLCALKADPQVFALMLGGVRTVHQAGAELADDVMAWGKNGFGMWSICDTQTRSFMGITGLERRQDGRGVALRFALWPEAQGRGLAREAAAAALRFGHERARLSRIIAVARESNFASRMVLGGIGMVECSRFVQQNWQMVLYESVAIPIGRAADASH